MKKLVMFFLLLVLNACIISAHEVNNYKYMCIDIDKNPYELETFFKKGFEGFGFTVIDNEQYKIMDPQQRRLVLVLNYSYDAVWSGYSWISLELKDASGATVWSTTETACVLSPRTDMNRARKKVLEEFEQLGYKFNKSVLESSADTLTPYGKWDEDSVKHYLNTRKIKDIEGIYKNYDLDDNYYRFAIIEYCGEYVGILLETDNKFWMPGDIKMKLSHIQGGTYDVVYYSANKQKINMIGELENRILDLKAPSRKQTTQFVFVKIYPTGTGNVTSDMTHSGELLSTGSGILLSENIIVTNNHVVENANKIEAVLNVKGIPEKFSAKILCVDKANDLAIVCIKDDKFKSPGIAPFSISPKSVEVGTSVLAMGYPMSQYLGEEVKVTDGIISSNSGYDGDISNYQISAPIQPGNSGGPLFDRRGNLIGITSSGIDKRMADNVGYAIKSPYILNLIDSAPIYIAVPSYENNADKDLPTLIKKLKPFVAYLKIY